jgi:hypothetical protein
MLKADGFDDAIIGTACTWRENQRVDILVYDLAKMASILVEGGMTYEEAEEYIDYNIEGAYMGIDTPIYVNLGGHEFIDV